MPRLSSSIAVAASPTVTDLFRATDVGGADGPPAAALVVGAAATSAFPIAFRVEDPLTPVGESFTLAPGSNMPVADRLGIKHVTAVGVGGAGTAEIAVVRTLR